MKRLAVALIALALPSVASADTTSYVVASTGASIASGATFTAIDLIASPQSRIYGGVELGVNAALAASQFYVAATIDVARDEGNTANFMAAGLGVWNLALAVHGGYLLLREERVEPLGVAFDVGSTHGVITPAAVSDGRAVAAGAMIGGSF